MATFKLTSNFGYRRDPVTRRVAVHTGQDFGGPRNAPVLATASGRVVESGRAGAYGIMVAVDHGMGISTRYAHLRRAMVRTGQKVRVGQQVGIMGNTGRSTGAHLHYEVRVDGEPLDPAKFLTAGGRLQRLVGD
jgi:murein DD-endopeptidase MepM/ murein hydrolase activator NlpD